MAQLKDLIVTGPSRFLNDLYALTIYEGGVKLEDKYYLATNPSGYISDLSTAINGLSVGSSPSQPGDYLVSQYAGASQTSYHRRPVYLVAQAVLGYTTSGTNYAVKMDTSSHKLYVTVPSANIEDGTADGQVLIWNVSDGMYRATTPTWTSNTGTVIGSGLTSDQFVVGNGGVNVKISSLKPTTSSTTWSTSSDVNVPTMKAISSYVTGAYTFSAPLSKNSSNVVSLALGTGLTTSNNALTIDSGWLDDTLANYVPKVTSTDNAIVRFDGTSGTVQNSAVKIDDNGVLIAKDNMYADSYSGALNMANSNIYGVNSIYFADASDSAQEAINFYRSSTTVDSIWASNGKLYFTPNRTLGAYGTTYEILHLGRSVPEAYLSWGGKNFSASYGPIDAAMIGTLGANRFELLKPGTTDNPGIEVFYSRDAGSTWIDYGLDNNQKRNIFNSTVGTTVIIGKRAVSDTKSVDDRAKIVIHTGAAGVYTSLNKFALYVNTAGSTNCWVTIDKCIQNKDYSVESNWENVVTKVPIAGWSGWNIINTSNFTTYGYSPASQYGHLRFVFGADTAGSTSYSGLQALIIAGFGGVGWSTPSNLAKSGHAYSWDYEGTAIFQAGVIARGNVTADARNGTASATGTSYLIAGNGTFYGTNNNSRGILRLYGTGSGYAHIQSVSSDSTSTTYSLPAYSTNQYIASVEGTGVTSGALAEFNSATGHMVSGPKYDTAASNSTIARRTSNGYLYATYFNTTVGQFNPSSYANPSVAFIDQDGWLRKSSKASFISWLGLKQLAFVEATSSDVGKYLKAVDDGDAIDYEWSTPPTGMSNPMTTANDIIIGGTSGAATRLAKGSNGTFLGINSSGNVGWVDNPIPFNGDNDSDVLMWDGTTEKPYWITPPWLEKLIFNAGEIIIGSSNGDPMALSKGSTGQVLTTTSSGNRVAWQNATVRMNANTGSTALSVLLAPSDVSNGASKEAQYANTSGKQLKFTPSTGNLSGVAQINGSTVPSSPKFTDTLADYITEWYNEYSDELTGIVKYAYDHTPALYLDGAVSWSEMSHMWSSSPGVGSPMLTVTNTTSQYNDNWLTGWNFRAPNMTTAPSLPTNQSMAYANFAAINLGKPNSQGEFTAGNSGSIVFHYEGDNSNYNWISFGLHSKDHILQMRGDKTVRTRGFIYMNCDDTTTGGDGHLVASQDWALSTFVQKCLIKGTKILMADGTEKNIEDVKRGDEVKSMDINSGKMITAMVVSCKKTGIEHEYTTHLFDNGSYVVTYGPHSVYNKTLGHPTDISKFRIGDETYDAEGNVITYAGNMRYYDRSTDVAHYDINTSNNLYFANGILNGKNVFAKYRCMRREEMDIPAPIQAVLDRQETANKPTIGYETDPNYFRAIAAKLKEKSAIAKRIEEAKQKLADSDYLVAKFTEGLISAVDWLKAKAERSNWRTAINNDEPLLEAADNAIKAIKAKYQTDDSSVKDRFELFSAWDNAALEYYREWLTSIRPSEEKHVFTNEELDAYLAEEEKKAKNQDLT